MLALLLAISIGVLASAKKTVPLLTLSSWVEPIGRIWVGFLKMVIIPLLISLLVTSVASKEKVRSKHTTPLLRRTVVVFAAVYTIMLLVALLLVPLLLQLLPSTLSLVTLSTDGVVANTKPLSFIDQLISWVPENPFKSASDGAILPVVIFSLLFGLALNHVAEDQRKTVINFFHAVGGAMLKIVDWVLRFAPLGIFCIVFPLACQVGAQIVGTLGFYILLQIIMHVICIILLCLLATTFAKISLLTFVRACFKPQLIALGTQSSIASLPAMITASEQKLMLSPKVTSVVLPMAVSVFKVGTVVTNVIYVLFTARMYHIEIAGMQWLTLFVVAFAAAVGAAGLPGSASVLAPLLTLFTAMGLPVQGIPILFAMDTIPDMADTAANVTGDITAAAIVAKHQASTEEQQSRSEENVILEADIIS